MPESPYHVTPHNTGDAESLANAKLAGKLGFVVRRGSVQFLGKFGVRPALGTENIMWNALLEVERKEAYALVADMERQVTENGK